MVQNNIYSKSKWMDFINKIKMTFDNLLFTGSSVYIVFFIMNI